MVFFFICLFYSNKTQKLQRFNSSHERQDRVTYVGTKTFIKHVWETNVIQQMEKNVCI